MVRFGKKIDYFPLLSTYTYICMCIYMYTHTHMQKKMMPGKIKKYKVQLGPEMAQWVQHLPSNLTT